MPYKPQSPPEASPYRADVKITGLGPKIGDPVAPAEFPEQILRFRNDRWDKTVGLDNLHKSQWLDHFGRFAPLPENLDPPLALRYHGHQFRHYNPEIGDGRGFLFAQMRDHENRLMDLGTKGSGTTPWSRTGDGKLTLKGAVREILATEMLEALGVCTSKTFSVVETGEELMRNDEPSPTRSAVMTRLNYSHIRYGSFQRIAFEKDAEMMSSLTRYCLNNYFAGAKTDNPAAKLFEHTASRAAALAASYMTTGFVHGVLNTDNINITGESFDYGPWRFTPYWEPGFTAAYFDHDGLYCFARQPEALHWNLAQLASSLTLITDSKPLVAILESFPRLYGEAFAGHFLWRVGLKAQGFDKDRPIVVAAEKALSAKTVTIDQFFHDWRGVDAQYISANPAYSSDEFKVLLKEIQNHEVASPRNHPYWELPEPCSMHIEEVEDIWAAIAEHDDWEKLYHKVTSVRAMGDALRCADKS